MRVATSPMSALFRVVCFASMALRYPPKPTAKVERG